LSDDPGNGYQGVIGKTLADSTPWWPPRKSAPEGAPNVVIARERYPTAYRTISASSRANGLCDRFTF